MSIFSRVRGLPKETGEIREVSIDLIDFPSDDPTVLEIPSAEGLELLGDCIINSGQWVEIIVLLLPNGRYICVDGRHRVSSLRRRGATHVRARVLPQGISRAEALIIAHICNCSHRKVDALEEGHLIKSILESDPTLTQAALAKRLGRTETRLSQILALCELPDGVFEHIRSERSRDKSERYLSRESILREIARLNDRPDLQSKAVEIAQRVSQEGLSASQVGLLIDQAIGDLPVIPRPGRPRTVKPFPIPEMQTELVKGTIKAGRVSLTIHFDGDNPLRPTLQSVGEIFLRPDFDPTSLLTPKASDCGTPAFWQQGMKGGDGLGLDVPCLAGTVGSTEGKEVNK